MGLFRVDKHEGARLMGRTDGQDYSGVIFPYRFPGISDVREYRLRLDTAAELWDADGEKKRSAKYLSPPGDRGRLYYPPGVTEEMLDDASLPLLFLEGEKKTAASDRAGASTPKATLVAIGLDGVDNWKGTLQKPTSHNGHQKITAPLPELDRICIPGRKAFILFDADLATKPNVQWARKRLRQELDRRGMEAVCVNMPERAGCKGIDDLLGPSTVRAVSPPPQSNCSAYSIRHTATIRNRRSYCRCPTFLHLCPNLTRY